MQTLHCTRPVTGKNVGQHLEREVDAGVQLLAFGLGGSAQYIAGHQAAMAWMANAQTQAVEIVLIA